MRAKAVTAEEQYRLIMECRASGMTKVSIYQHIEPNHQQALFSIFCQ